MVSATSISLNEALIRLAAIHEKEVEFTYVKGKGFGIERRCFVPKTVSAEGTPDIRFTGRDPDREGIRSFRLDRIRGSVKLHT